MKTGILLTQMGTPDAPEADAVRRYLAQFLSDRRVVDVNPFVWWFILHGIILRTRPRKAAAAYAKIWKKEGSPLLFYTRRQAELLNMPDAVVTFGMRYGNPSIESSLDSLRSRGCTRIVFFPLYPQYAEATTASACDAFFAHLSNTKWNPEVSVVDAFFAGDEYINALATVINENLSALPRPPQYLILSYHGLPEKVGSEYNEMCRKTTDKLTKKLGERKFNILHTYQSRFGREEWLQPYTDTTIKELAAQGIKRVAVACPGFTADCLETLYEIGIEASEVFKSQGGETFTLIPCLNDHAAWIEGMRQILSDVTAPQAQEDSYR